MDDPVLLSTDVVITGNIVSDILTSDAVLAAGDNLLVNYDDPTSPEHVAEVFVDPYGGAYLSDVDLTLRPDSTYADSGYGAPASQFDNLPDVLTAAILRQEADYDPSAPAEYLAYDFDADLSFAASTTSSSDLQYFWDFGDGNVATGSTVQHEYDTHGSYEVTLRVVDADGNDVENVSIVDIPDPILLDLEISGDGLSNGSTSGAIPVFEGTDPDSLDDYLVTQGNGPVALALSNDSEVGLGLNSRQLAALDQFSFTVDLQTDDFSSDDTDMIVYLHGVMNLQLDGQELVFNWQEQDGSSGSLRTDFSSNEWSSISVSYDTLGGNVSLFINDDLAASSFEPLDGLLDRGNTPLRLGYPFPSHDDWTIDALIADVVVRSVAYEPIDPAGAFDEFIFITNSTDYLDYRADDPISRLFEFEETTVDVRLLTSAGDERIEINGVDNTVKANGGDDVIQINGADHWVWGGSGADIVEINETTADATWFDFEDGVDRIDVSHFDGVNGMSDLIITERTGGSLYVRLANDPTEANILRIKDSEATVVLTADDFIF
jgi:hypothetical protein